MRISAGAEGDQTEPGEAAAGAPTQGPTGRQRGAAAPVDLAALRVSLREGGVEDLLEPLVASFLHEAPGRVARIETAVRAADAEQIRQSAHAYKSSAAQLGARELAEALQALELAGLAGDFAAAGRLATVVRREHETVCAALAAATVGGE